MPCYCGAYALVKQVVRLVELRSGFLTRSAVPKRREFFYYKVLIIIWSKSVFTCSAGCKAFCFLRTCAISSKLHSANKTVIGKQVFKTMIQNRYCLQIEHILSRFQKPDRWRVFFRYKIFNLKGFFQTSWA